MSTHYYGNAMKEGVVLREKKMGLTNVNPILI